MNIGKFDVIVCGAGVAGCAAAIGAARRGMKTCLLESNVIPGGLATAGLVLVYLPLCDGYGHQTIFGLSERFLRAANWYGPAEPDEEWKAGTGKRLQTYFSPASLVLALDKLLVEAGVDVWYDTRVTGVRTGERRITGITVFNKSGEIHIDGEVFVDATGDADLAHLAGEPCLTAGNASVSWFVEHRDGHKSSAYSFGRDFSTLIQADPIWRETVAPGIDGKIVSDYVISTRKRYRELLEQEYASGAESRHSRYPLLLPTMATLRHTRCIQGRKTLEPGDEFGVFEDSIGLAPDWRKCGPLWEIPYGALLAGNIDNLLVAGRGAAARGDAWEITRVIPVAAMTGEAAGCAGALAVENRTAPAGLNVTQLQQTLHREYGFPIHYADLGLDSAALAHQRERMNEEKPDKKN